MAFLHIQRYKWGEVIYMGENGKTSPPAFSNWEFNLMNSVVFSMGLFMLTYIQEFSWNSSGFAWTSFTMHAISWNDHLTWLFKADLSCYGYSQLQIRLTQPSHMMTIMAFSAIARRYYSIVQNTLSCCMLIRCTADTMSFLNMVSFHCFLARAAVTSCCLPDHTCICCCFLSFHDHDYINNL